MYIVEAAVIKKLDKINQQLHHHHHHHHYLLDYQMHYQQHSHTAEFCFILSPSASP
jgi:hypothetical protein